jgi:hypothetical protein
MFSPKLKRQILASVLLVGLLGVGMNIQGQTNYSIFSDELDNGFLNRSTGTNNFASSSPVHSGVRAISMRDLAGKTIAFGHTDFNPTSATNLIFWANGGTAGGQILEVYVQYNNSASSGPVYPLPPLPKNSWEGFSLSLNELGLAGVTNISQLNFELTGAGTTGLFSLDDISLTSTNAASLATNSPVHVRVDATQTLRGADARWFGLNTAIWDGYLDSSYTMAALRQLGTGILRFPGGSAADGYHWASPSVNDSSKFINFVHTVTNIGAQTMITVNYGTGTPQEAAAWVNSANITNHYRFKYWEVGNECYGTWETDSNSYPHDPYTYAVRAAQYIAQMKAVDPTIKIGVPSQPGEDSYANGYTNHPAYNARTHSYHNGWTPVVLGTLKSLGASPDFLIHHVYPEYQTDNDEYLLSSSGNWAGDAASFRQEISDYFGAGGTNIELLCTENNADAGNQGRQSTSIVNGLYLADSLAHLMETEFNAYIWWDLRNGQDTGGDFDPSLYGWRTYGDLGVIGNANTYYPTFYTFKLMQYFARPGDTVLNATSDYASLTSYAARKADGALNWLVINKNNAANLDVQMELTNFVPGATATMRSFGITQDEATRTNSVIPGAQDIATNTWDMAGTNFSVTVLPYTMTLYTFAPAAPKLQTIALTGGNYIFQLQGQAGVPYEIESSTNLFVWTSNATVTLSNATWNLTNNASGGAKFWRAIWRP